MAAPNLIGASTALGKSSGTLITSNTATTVLNNPASSGKCLKVNTLNISNFQSNTVSVTVFLYNQANVGGTGFHIVGNTAVPGLSTFSVIDKTGSYYLEENTSIGVTSNTANTLTVTCSYEEIS